MTHLASPQTRPSLPGPLGPGPLGAVLRVVTGVVQAAQTPVTVVVEGGHHDPRLGADAFALTSMDAALQLTEALIRTYDGRVRVMLAVLVDDLGLGCGPDACTRDTPLAAPAPDTLPAALEARLSAHRLVRRDRVVLTTERNARNRGLAALRGWEEVPDLLAWHGGAGARRKSWGLGVRSSRDYPTVLDPRAVTVNTKTEASPARA